jgi:hypothetical protein
VSSLALQPPAATEYQEPRGRRRKGPRQPHQYPPDFEAFWKEYPRKTEKSDAFAAWQETALVRPPMAELLVALLKCRYSPQWKEDGGKYIVYPARWLRREGWENRATETLEGRDKDADLRLIDPETQDLIESFRAAYRTAKTGGT